MSREQQSEPFARPDSSLESSVPEASQVPASLRSLVSEVGDDEEDLFGNRVEWKYVLTAEVAARLREEVAARLRLEEFIPGRKKTLMHSVYFDSDDLMLYRRSVMVESSLKFRLRTYTTWGGSFQTDPHGFFECKIGKRGKKFKLRTMMPVVRAGDLLHPARAGAVGTGRLNLSADHRFMLKARRVLGEFKMRARLTVSYVREAFVSENGRLRITLDELYRAARIDTGDRSPLTPGPLGLDVVIAELKFVGAPPPWLEALLAEYGLPMGGVQFSKFRQGVALAYPEVAGGEPAAPQSPVA